ncbi:MAG: Maf family protein [Thermoleophilia bacterium]|nr:Maf family protein [Thermoleophilia bacterium]
MSGRPFPAGFELFLASRSPRRRELLASLGAPFRVVPSEARETLVGTQAGAVAEGNALAKARAAVLPQRVGEGSFVLGVDTVVVVDGAILGKPADREEAGAMLARLAGRRHEVVSGVALARGAENRRGAKGSIPDAGGPSPVHVVAHAVTAVRFSPLNERQVEAYLASGEWEGKAGAYAIQGLAALFVEGIEGEYANVVGLPLALLARLFRRLGFDLVTRTWL